MYYFTYPGERDWGTCTRCRLCGTRRRVVRSRVRSYNGDGGTRLLVLFDSPSENEESIGSFGFGHRGRLLRLLFKDQPVTLCITGILACTYDGKIPTKVPEVPFCLPRLTELTEYWKPEAIVSFGKIAYPTRLPLIRLSLDFSKMEFPLIPFKRVKYELDKFLCDLKNTK